MSEKKLVAIFGAGATSAFIDGLYTKYLTDNLLDVENWKPVKRKIEEEINAKRKMGVLALNISIDFIAEALSVIKNISNDYKGEISFEDMVFIFDQIFAHIFPEMLRQEFYHIDSFLFRCLRDIFYQHPLKNIRAEHTHYYPYILRETIVDSVLKKWNDYKRAGKYREDLAAIKAFIERLDALFDAVSLYSLNYDPLLYEANKLIVDATSRYTTGFETSDNQFFPQQFYFNRYDSDLNPKTLAFLHGHVGFCMNENVRDSLVFNDAYEANYKRRLQYWQNFGKNRIYDTFLVSGRYTNKTGSYLFDPYTTYMSKYSRDIQNATHILLIGVGLSDYHIFLHFNKRLFPKTKVCVVNMDREWSADDMNMEGWAGKLKKIYKADSELWKFVFGEEYQIGNRDLKEYTKNGYIFLSDGQILFYHKGARDYFEAIVNGRNELLMA